MKSDNFKVVKFHIFLVLYFYLYPRMKKEYQQRGLSWKRYYDVCGDDNRQSYRELFLQILKKE
jgi:hypothetical protein